MQIAENQKLRSPDRLSFYVHIWHRVFKTQAATQPFHLVNRFTRNSNTESLTVNLVVKYKLKVIFQNYRHSVHVFKRMHYSFAFSLQ